MAGKEVIGNNTKTPRASVDVDLLGIGAWTYDDELKNTALEKKDIKGTKLGVKESQEGKSHHGGKDPTVSPDIYFTAILHPFY
ncbi:hypothetical protein FHL15_004533 [Xylaria flabelliformis]|uniref:Uncharacterized protein n=1 Tax=Xylaria flabelliformis TaxID=2512241 RepID=A0A553I307_9PEZI|nr:hypothetical protein FHL15_004533 [Xylaria flabelliformis]